ncbi:MAG: insulinase family protein [Cyclobacteriaceae bacterium]|nr:insulinase family protein [Cyclobacteriaceae bacterium SS2]
MINYHRESLRNGLDVIVHEDHSSSTVCLNLLYKVGARNEDPEKTGFAHLFEHLMFGGSKHVKNFDEPLQKVGGENNAFTSNDITNYYVTIPSDNVETAFWLESDRMLSLSFDPEVLEVQRRVVIEEFKQRYLNQPYGDVWLKLRPMAYKKHAYQWPTIGKDISHIENATMEDVKNFFFQYYRPSNAILVVAGDITVDRAMKLSEKWFGGIDDQKTLVRMPDMEPEQSEAREMIVQNKVPVKAIYKTYHMAERVSERYYSEDLLSDILGRGHSSILYQKLVKEKKYFSGISSYITGNIDPGLMVISGKLNEGVDEKMANAEIEKIIQDTIDKGIQGDDLEKVKNQSESSHLFSQIEVLNRAMGLAFAAFLGNIDLVNNEQQYFRKVTKDEVVGAASRVLRPTNCSTLFYLPEN